MKKISNILLAVTFALPLFTACETDNDSNPIQYARVCSQQCI